MPSPGASPTARGDPWTPKFVPGIGPTNAEVVGSIPTAARFFSEFFELDLGPQSGGEGEIS
jgi:hypothetical protein